MSTAELNERAPFEREALSHLDALYAFALKLARSRDDAEDLVSDTLLRAWADVVDDGEPRMLLPGRELEQGDDERGTGRGLAHVVHRDDPEGLTHPVEHVRFATDPPQL